MNGDALRILTSGAIERSEVSPWAMVNAGVLPVYADIDPHRLKLVEDAIFYRSPDASEKLIRFAEEFCQTS